MGLVQMNDLEQVSGSALGCFLVDEDIKCGVTFDSRNGLINIYPPFPRYTLFRVC